MMEKMKIKGRLRPYLLMVYYISIFLYIVIYLSCIYMSWSDIIYLLVHESDILPSIGTVNRARKGATPRMMDM